MLIARYVAREVAVALAAVTGVLYLIYISHRLVRFLAEAEQGGLPGRLLLELLALKSLSNLPALLPLALFLAVLLAFGRLHRDAEAVALAACRAGPGRVLAGVLMVSLPVAGLVAAVSLGLGPWAERRAAALQARAQAEAETEALIPGRFQLLRGGRVVFYARERGPKGRLQGLFVQTRLRGSVQVVVAHQGRLLRDGSGHRYLELAEGWRYEGRPGEGPFRAVRFRRHGILLQPASPASLGLPLAALPTGALEGPRGRAELHWRLGLPLATLLLALLAVPLSRSRPRQGRSARLLTGVVLYLVYMNLLALGRSWLGHGQLPDWAGLWWAHLPLLLLWLGLLAREQGWLRRSRA